MDPGEISKSSLLRSRDGKEAFRLVLLVDRTQPHRANLKEDYSRLQMMATMQRKQEVVEEWVAEKIGGDRRKDQYRLGTLQLSLVTLGPPRTRLME